MKYFEWYDLRRAFLFACDRAGLDLDTIIYDPPSLDKLQLHVVTLFLSRSRYCFGTILLRFA